MQGGRSKAGLSETEIERVGYGDTRVHDPAGNTQYILRSTLRARSASRVGWFRQLGWTKGPGLVAVDNLGCGGG